jgi:hypothetical protein
VSTAGCDEGAFRHTPGNLVGTRESSPDDSYSETS